MYCFKLYKRLERLYGNLLLRGNRSVKKHALSTSNGFYSPNYGRLGTVEHDKMQLEYGSLRRAQGVPNTVDVTSEISKSLVYILDVYPDMDTGILDYIFNKSNQEKDVRLALIIRTYGTGNVPTKPSGFLEKIQSLVDNNVLIVNITQCHEGRVELRLFETGSNLFDIGVINGGDTGLFLRA
jgi:L-asparaginase